MTVSAAPRRKGEHQRVEKGVGAEWIQSPDTVENEEFVEEKF